MEHVHLMYHTTGKFSFCGVLLLHVVFYSSVRFISMTGITMVARDDCHKLNHIRFRVSPKASEIYLYVGH